MVLLGLGLVLPAVSDDEFMRALTSGFTPGDLLMIVRFPLPFLVVFYSFISIVGFALRTLFRNRRSAEDRIFNGTNPLAGEVVSWRASIR